MFDNTTLLEQQDRLAKHAFRLTYNQADADDLVQSTFLRAIEKKHLFKEGTNLYGWLKTIMQNMFISGYRRKTKFESQYDPEPYLEKQSVGASQDTQMTVQDVSYAMNTIPDDHKEILMMVCVQGMPYAKVSEKINIPVGTVRSRLSRARQNLQNAMEQPKNADWFFANVARNKSQMMA